MDFLMSDDRARRKPTVRPELLQYSSPKVHIFEHACSDKVRDFVWCFSLMLLIHRWKTFSAWDHRWQYSWH